jgi:polyhydroxyalkanoate synthesis regulator phasin
MQDAWRAYLELAFGLTEASRKKAREVARELLGRGEATAAQVQSFVDDLLSTSRTNRDGLVRLVRYEVDRAFGAVGVATSDEVAELTARLRELERRLTEPGPVAATAPSGTGPARKPMAKKAVPKKAVPEKAVPEKAVPKKTAPAKAVPEKTAKQAGPGPARKASGRKTTG